jgi:hypothetical protein
MMNSLMGILGFIWRMNYKINVLMVLFWLDCFFIEQRSISDMIHYTYERYNC